MSKIILRLSFLMTIVIDFIAVLENYRSVLYRKSTSTHSPIYLLLKRSDVQIVRKIKKKKENYQLSGAWEVQSTTWNQLQEQQSNLLKPRKVHILNPITV